VKVQNIQHVAKREGSCQPSPRAVLAPFSIYIYLYLPAGNTGEYNINI
jgi:hypothetical protein